jgi:hypothetical protein
VGLKYIARSGADLVAKMNISHITVFALAGKCQDFEARSTGRWGDFKKFVLAQPTFQNEFPTTEDATFFTANVINGSVNVCELQDSDCISQFGRSTLTVVLRLRKSRPFDQWYIDNEQDLHKRFAGSSTAEQDKAAEKLFFQYLCSHLPGKLIPMHNCCFVYGVDKETPFAEKDIAVVESQTSFRFGPRAGALTWRVLAGGRCAAGSNRSSISWPGLIHPTTVRDRGRPLETGGAVFRG